MPGFAATAPSLWVAALCARSVAAARSSHDGVGRRLASGGQSRATRQPRRSPWERPVEAAAKGLKRRPLALMHCSWGFCVLRRLAELALTCHRSLWSLCIRLPDARSLSSHEHFVAVSPFDSLRIVSDLLRAYAVSIRGLCSPSAHQTFYLCLCCWPRATVAPPAQARRLLISAHFVR